MWIDPAIFKIGFLEIRYYGLVYVIGIIFTYLFILRNSHKVGLKKSDIEDLMMYLLVGMLLFSRIFHFLFSDPLVFFREPLEFFKLWHGGMSFFGGLFGSVLGVFLFCRKNKAGFFKLADFIVIPVSFTLILGRIANFINNEIVGTVTNIGWCINFPGYSGCRHPYQLYASFSHLIMFLLLLFVFSRKNKEKLKNGIVFFFFTLIYGVFRFVTDFFREDTRFLSLTIWQYFSILLVIISLFFLYKYKKRRSE